MVTLLDLLTSLLPMLYGIAAVNYFVIFVRRDEFAARFSGPLLGTAVAVHAVYLLMNAVHLGRTPMASAGEGLCAIAFAVAAVYLYVEKIQKRKETGVFIIGMVLPLQIVASALLPHSQPPRSELMANPLFGSHTFTAVLGYSAFAVGAVYGIMYMLLYRALKRLKFGLIFERLPSLDELARMGFGATFVGWIFLTITIGLGALMSLELFPDFYKDSQFIRTVAVWVVYSAAVASYFLLGWRGARTVALSLVGFVFAVAALVASSVMWNSFHQSMS